MKKSILVDLILLSTNATLCLILNLLFITVSIYLPICPDRYLGDDGIGTYRREILHDGTHRFRTQCLPFGDGIPKGSPEIPKFLA